MRDSFVVYRSFYKSLMSLSPKQAMDVFRAVGEYALDDKEPTGDGIGKAFFEQYRLIIDKNNKNYENGKKGGRPPKNKEPDNNRTETESKPNNNRTETQKEKGERRKEKDLLSGLQPSLSDESENGGGERAASNEFDAEGINETEGTDESTQRAKYPYKAVIDYLNAKTGRNYSLRSKDTKKKLNALFEQGYTYDEITKTIDNAWDAWKNDPHLRECVRPGTIFGDKFDDYLNMNPENFAARTKANRTKFSNFPERDNDFAATERKLLECGM